MAEWDFDTTLLQFLLNVLTKDIELFKITNTSNQKSIFGSFTTIFYTIK